MTKSKRRARSTFLEHGGITTEVAAVTAEEERFSSEEEWLGIAVLELEPKRFDRFIFADVDDVGHRRGGYKVVSNFFSFYFFRRETVIALIQMF